MVVISFGENNMSRAVTLLKSSNALTTPTSSTSVQPLTSSRSVNVLFDRGLVNKDQAIGATTIKKISKEPEVKVTQEKTSFKDKVKTLFPNKINKPVTQTSDQSQFQAQNLSVDDAAKQIVADRNIENYYGDSVVKYKAKELTQQEIDHPLITGLKENFKKMFQQVISMPAVTFKSGNVGFWQAVGKMAGADETEMNNAINTLTQNKKQTLQESKLLQKIEKSSDERLAKAVLKDNEINERIAQVKQESGIDDNKVKSFVYDLVTQQAPQLATQFAIAKIPYVGQTASVSFGYTMSYMEMYEDALANGANEEKANQISSLYALYASPLEYLPIDNLLGDKVSKKFIQVAIQTLEEGGTEALQTYIQNSLMKNSKIDPDRNKWEGVAEAGLAGGILGGVTGTIDISIQKMQEKDQQTTNETATKTTKQEQAVTSTKKDTSKAIQKTEAYMDAKKNYVNNKDFVAEEFGVKESDKFGFVESSNIIPRDVDKLDRNTVESYKNKILAGEKIEPIVGTVENGKLTTTDGTHRAVAYQELGLKAPVIVTKGELEGVNNFKKELKMYLSEKNDIKPLKQTVQRTGTKNKQEITKDRIYNINNNNDYEYLSRIFGEERLEDFKKGYFGNYTMDRIEKIIHGKLNFGEKENILSDLNPTGGLYVKYDPESRMKMKLGENITTLDKTMGKKPSDTITIYRGATKNQKSIVGGDFVTTNYELAKSYTDDEGIVLEKKVKLSDVLDDKNEPLGEEYIYRPKKKTTKETTGQALSSKGAESISKYETRTSTSDIPKDFKLFNRVQELKEKYASKSTIGEGYTPKGSVGAYYQDTGNVRVNGMNDISVATHELSHFIDKKYDITKRIGRESQKNVIQELTRMYEEYYPGGKKTHEMNKRVVEGFATLIQKYIETPTTISENYPVLVEEFLTKGGEYYNPVIEEFINDAGNVISDYQRLTALDKVMSRMTNKTNSEKRKSFLTDPQRVATAIENDIVPLEVIAKVGKVTGTSQDPSLWAYAYRAVNSVIGTNIFSKDGYFAFNSMDGGFTKKHDFNWNTMINDLNGKGQLDNFAGYLIARREYYNYQRLHKLEGLIKDAKERIEDAKNRKKALDDNKKLSKFNKEKLQKEYDKNIKSINDEIKMFDEKKVSLEEILKNDQISEEEATNAWKENKESFKDYEEQFDTMVKEDLDYLHNPEVGLVTDETYKELTRDKGYASFKRDFYDEIVGEQAIPSSMKVGKTRVSSLIGRKGSSRAIINPLASSVFNHSEIMKKATRQLVYNKVARVFDQNRTAFGKWVQKVETKVLADKSGKISYPQEKDSSLLSARNYEGKREFYLMDGELKGYIDNILTYENVDIFSAMATGLARSFTQGTTANYPAFAVTNFIRDQLTAYVNSKNKFVPLMTPLNTLIKIMNKDSVDYKYFREYIDQGGERQTQWGWQRLSPDQLFDVVTKENKGLKKLIKLAEKGVDTLSMPGEYSEIITRASEYIKVRKQGKPIVFALEEAGRITAPFHHIGSWKTEKYGKSGKNYIKSIPFFNASLQVLSQTKETLSTEDGRKRFAMLSLMTLASYVGSLAYLMANSSDDQKEQYKDLYAEDLARFIYIPKPSGKGLIRIPVNEQGSVIATAVNMYLGSKLLDTEYSGKEYLAGVSQWIPSQLNPAEPIKMVLSWLPQWVKAIGYPILNVKDYPEVKPLESEGMKYLKPGDRYNEYTSKIAKKIGQKANISPVRIDALITGVFGRSSGFVTQKPNVYEFFTSIDREWYFTMGRSINRFWDEKERIDQEYNSYQNGKTNLTNESASKLYRDKKIVNDIYKLYQDYNELDLEKDVEKARQIRDDILNQMDLLKDNNYTPKDFNQWAKDAKKKRIKKLNEQSK